MTTDTTIRPLRYAHWQGTLSAGRWTWLVIVTTGVRLVLRDSKTRMLLSMNFAFVAALTGILYALSMLEVLAGTPQARGLYEFVKWFLKVDISGVAALAGLRGALWRGAFLVTLEGELFWVMLVVVLMGPGLIANDIKSRALPIYFAKPVTPLTYVAGKWLVLAACISAVVLVPNLLALLFGTLLTGGLETIGATLRLGGELIACGLLVCLLAGTIMLALSSLTADRRYVAAAWLAICLLSAVAQAVVNETLGQTQTGWLGCLSLWDNVVVLVNRVFDMRQLWVATSLAPEAFQDALVKPVSPLCAGVVTAAQISAALAICYRRVIRFSRSAANV